MKVIFRFQDLHEIVNDSFLALKENTTKAQRVDHRELSKEERWEIFVLDPSVCGFKYLWEDYQARKGKRGLGYSQEAIWWRWKVKESETISPRILI